MRLDMQRVRASSIRVGDTLCFPNPDMDFKVLCIDKRIDKRLVFNEDAAHPLKASDYVFKKVEV